MNLIYQTARKHVRLIKDYPLTFFIVLFLFAMVIYVGYSNHNIMQGLGYIFVVCFCAFVTDIVVSIKPKTAIGFPIKKPVKRELLAIFTCTFIGILMLCIRFYGGWDSMNRFVKLSLVVPLILFVFPIAIALIYLFRFKYKASELGINLHYWYLPVFIHIVVGAVTLSVAADKSHWKEEFQQAGIAGGIIDLVFTGIIGAALSEEFLRMLLQTRLGKAFKNLGLGFVTATFIWAAMHIPVEWQHEKTINWTVAMQRVFTLMPIGLLWGYVTHRTKSLIPSVFIHGLNLWGLQNMLA